MIASQDPNIRTANTSASNAADTRKARLCGTGLLLLAALAWGGGNVFQKTILDHLDAFAATGIPCLLGAAVLYPFSRRERRVSNDPAIRILIAVAVSFTLAATLIQTGYGHTTVTNAGFLVNTSAVLTPLLSWTLYRHRPPFLIWPASICALAGVFLMGGGGLTTLVSGDILAIASACAFAIWNIFVAQYVLRCGRPIHLTVVQLLCCGVVCITLSGSLHGLPKVSDIWAALPEIVMLGVVSKGLAYVLMAMGLRHVSASSGAVLVSAESIFGAACAILILGESPETIRMIGGGVILCAVILAACAPTNFENKPARC